MPFFLRILLLTAASLTAYWILTKIRKAQVKTEDAIFWVVFSTALIFLALVPGFSDWLSNKIGIDSSDSLIFLVTIGMLFFKVFALSVRISVLENKLSLLTTELAIRLKEKKDLE